MTMHLLPSYYTTTSFKKRKPKKKTSALIQEEIKLQKLLKKVGYQKDSGYRPDLPNYRVTKTNAELSNGVGNGSKRTTKQYTGDEILGFGVLHKSNVVPIRKDSNDAKEIARMRRG